MAKYRATEEEHAFKKIQRDIKNKNLNNLLFLFGEEQYLVNWAIDEIVKLYIGTGTIELNCGILNWNETSLYEIEAYCETLPMFAEKRIVIIEDFKTGKDKQNEEEVVEDRKTAEFTEYIKDIPESCILILTSETADKRKKIFKTIGSIGCCYEFGRLNEGDTRAFIRKRIRQAGKTVETAVIRRIIEMSGYFDKQSNYTLFSLDNDIKKLIAYSGENVEIRISDLNAGLSKNTESYVFDMIDAISSNKKGEALVLLHNLLNSGESWQKLLALICSGYEFILIVKELKDEGASLKDIKDETGGHEYRIKIATGLSGRFTTDQLHRILRSCFAVDKNIKSGLLEDRLAMELLIAGI